MFSPLSRRVRFGGLCSWIPRRLSEISSSCSNSPSASHTQRLSIPRHAGPCCWPPNSTNSSFTSTTYIPHPVISRLRPCYNTLDKSLLSPGQPTLQVLQLLSPALIPAYNTLSLVVVGGLNICLSQRGKSSMDITLPFPFLVVLHLHNARGL